LKTLEVKEPVSILFKVPKREQTLEIFKGQKLFYIRPLPNVYSWVNFKSPETYRFDSKIDVVKISALRIAPELDKLVKLPAVERIPTGAPVTITENFSIDFTPARFDRFTGELQICKGFNELPEEVQEFILWHELGHRYYSTEHFCDLYATKRFLESGGNPSQCIMALKGVLRSSPENLKRIEFINNSIS